MTKEQFIVKFQENLALEFTGTQHWWTKSLFHFSDISNAISILELGKIYSRNKVNNLNIMKNDNANDEVISLTDQEYKNYTRLYFGPSTPTQKNNEGIKPKDKILNNAHCPIPVMFIFDFKKVFMIDDIRFTDGNLSTNPNIYGDISDLDKLNFRLIYHRSWFYPEDRDKIINARHSEVLVKDELALENNLRLIAVRSEAEKETLVYQLSFELKEKYQNKVYVQPQTGIFINDWLYIDKVSLIENQIHIQWHRCSNIAKCQNKYTLKIVATSKDNAIVKRLKKEQWYPTEGTQKINLSKELQNIPFVLEIYLDDIKVYNNIVGTI
jgi:hypothetical protein